ncbi:hypothetical protein [Actinocorallia populi]|uniref:hypothetical protein n=1 Tax=Actinocorallia populi TaxID=2079200 RepID=UPI000D0894ED|nr:hypothetical protein [Actinocorallia populi]
MSRIRQLAALTGAAALALTAVGAPAHAGTTEIRKVAGNTLYSGSAKATLIQNLVVNGGGTTTCTSASLNGTIDSDGNPLSITSASIGGCSGTASSITFLNMPWAGSVTYAPVAGGRDGTVALNGFTVRATVFGVQCTYGGNVVANGFNGSNANRPVPSNGQAQVNMAGITVNKTSGIFLCPSSASITQGVFALTTASDESLYVTGTYP